jgi:hypothetical protein
LDFLRNAERNRAPGASHLIDPELMGPVAAIGSSRTSPSRQTRA